MWTAAGVVLAGGRSARMGEPKAWLEWHGTTLLHRTAALLARTVDGPVVVVSAPGQELPALPAEVEVVADPAEGLGPMQGVAAGLTAVAERADSAFVCATDIPFLHPAFVRRVLRGLDESGADMLVPFARGYRQPLAAGYRTALAALIDRLLDENELRLGMLRRHCAAAQLDAAALLADPVLARHDPELASVVNVNTREDYAHARHQPAPEIVVERAPAGGRSRVVRAATLRAAAEAVGVRLDGQLVVALNGDRLDRGDDLLPLATGDRVSFDARG